MKRSFLSIILIGVYVSMVEALGVFFCYRKIVKLVSGFVTFGWFAGAALLASCSIEDFNTANADKKLDVNAAIGIPISTASFSILDLYKKQDTTKVKLYADKDGLLTLRYREALDTIEASDFLDLIPNQNATFTIPLDMGIPLPRNIPITSLPAGLGSYDLPFQDIPNGQKIESAEFSDGYLFVKFAYTVSTLGLTEKEFTISTDDIVVDGKGLSIKLSTYTDQKAISLKGAKYRCQKPNMVRFTIKSRFTKTFQFGSASLMFNFEVSNIKLSSVGGIFNFDKIEFENRAINLAFTKRVTSSKGINVRNPDIRLIFDNSFSIPFNFASEGIVAKVGGRTEMVTGFPSSTTILPCNATNHAPVISNAAMLPESNFINVLSRLPSDLNFKGAFSLDPNFVGKSGTVKLGERLIVTGDVLIPLDMSLNEIVFCDTVDADFGKALSSKIDQLKLKVLASNGYPFELLLQTYVLNDQMVVVDSLFQKPAKINSGGASDTRSNRATPSDFIIDLNPDRLKRLKEGRKVIYKASVSTLNKDMAKVFDVNKLDIKTVVVVKASYEM